MTEADEVADSIATVTRQLPTTMDEARAIVRRHMPDEGAQLVDNIAESLLAHARRAEASRPKAIKPQSLTQERYVRAWHEKRALR